MRAKPCGSLAVLFDINVLAVLLAIGFNDELLGSAEKIDVCADRLLTAKTKSIKLFVAKQHPELSLSVGRVLAELSGKFIRHRHTPHRFLCALRKEICLPLKGGGKVLLRRLRQNSLGVLDVLVHLDLQLLHPREIRFGAEISNELDRQVLAVKVARIVKQECF